MKTWLNFGEEIKKEARRKFWTLKRFFVGVGNLTYLEKYGQNVILERESEEVVFEML